MMRNVIQKYKNDEVISKEVYLATCIMLISGYLLWIESNLNLDKNLSIIINYLGLFFAICTIMLYVRISVKVLINPREVISNAKDFRVEDNSILRPITLALVFFYFIDYAKTFPIILIIPFSLIGRALYLLFKGKQY